MLKEAGGWGTLQAEVAAAQVEGLQVAQFQVATARSVAAAATAGQTRGVIVGAGTGSGKTLAFFLPAYALMAERAIPGRFGVQTLALYPRKELLGDQLHEPPQTNSSAQRLDGPVTAARVAWQAARQLEVRVALMPRQHPVK
jgi:ATP-dependent helicase Lhr and Lhr-like helicase